MRFYTQVLAKRLGLTGPETYDQLFEALRGKPPHVSLEHYLNVLADLALRECRDMTTAAKALTYNPERLKEQQ